MDTEDISVEKVVDDMESHYKGISAAFHLSMLNASYEANMWDKAFQAT